MRNIRPFLSVMLLCLLIAQRGHTKPDTTDSVTVSVKSIYSAIATGDSLDECTELSDSLRSAVLSAKDALHTQGLEIASLKDANAILGQISGNKDKIILNTEKAYLNERRWKNGLLVISSAFLILFITK